MYHSRERYHDVSILIWLGGRVRDVEPRSKVSMMIIRPPQHDTERLADLVKLVAKGGQ